MTVCVDTSIWLEYFNGGRLGPEIRDLLSATQRVITPAVVAAEVTEAARRRGGNSRTFLRFLQSRSDVVPVDAETARMAGKISARQATDENGWTLVESLVLATARQHQAKLVTRDPIYAGLAGVEVLTPPIGGA